MTEREWQLHQVDAAVRAGSPDATAAIEWYWAHGDARHTEFIQWARDWCEKSEVRAVFERLRPAPPVRVEGKFNSLRDWLAISSALGLDPEVLAWFDERVAAGDTPVPALGRLRRLVLERGRLRDCLAFNDPLHELRQWLEFVASIRVQFRDTWETFSSNLECTDAEVAFLRRLVELERPAQLAEMDAALATYERREAILDWLAKPQHALIKEILRGCPQ